jgi:hypothetical protein
VRSSAVERVAIAPAARSVFVSLMSSPGMVGTEGIDAAGFGKFPESARITGFQPGRVL